MDLAQKISMSRRHYGSAKGDLEAEPVHQKDWRMSVTQMCQGEDHQRLMEACYDCSNEEALDSLPSFYQHPAWEYACPAWRACCLCSPWSIVDGRINCRVAKQESRGVRMMHDDEERGSQPSAPFVRELSARRPNLQHERRRRRSGEE